MSRQGHFSSQGYGRPNVKIPSTFPGVALPRHRARHLTLNKETEEDVILTYKALHPAPAAVDDDDFELTFCRSRCRADQPVHASQSLRADALRPIQPGPLPAWRRRPDGQPDRAGGQQPHGGVRAQDRPPLQRRVDHAVPLMSAIHDAIMDMSRPLCRRP